MSRVDVGAVRASEPTSALDACRLLGLDAGSQRGHRIFVPCPSHAERTPSCAIETRQGRLVWCCHGCGAGGSWIDLVGAVQGIESFPDALRAAADLLGVQDGDAPAPRPVRALPPLPQPLTDAVFARIVAPILWCGRLDYSAIARDVSTYLDGRGLLGAAQEDGWAALPTPGECQREWVAALRSSADDVDGYRPTFSRKDLDRSGLLSASGDSLVFSGHRLAIPWRDTEGRVTTLQRRRLIDKPGDKGGKYVFATGRPAAYPYGIERAGDLPDDAQLLIVEGAVDVLACRALLAERGEVALVLGLPGVSSWRRHAGEWARLGRGRVVGVGVDVDAAGERVVGELAADLAAAGATRIERWTPPDGAHDWADAWAAVQGRDRKEAA